MTETDDIVARLNEKVLDLLKHNHCSAGWLMQDAADYITRLEERCTAYKGQVEAGAAEIEQANRLAHEAALATHRQAYCIQQCAAHIGPETSGTIEGLPSAVKTLVARADALQAEVERLREVLKTARSALVRAFSRIHALPRTADTELAKLIGEVLAKISTTLQPQEPKL